MKDIGILEDCDRVVSRSTEDLGGLDIVISNAVSFLTLRDDDVVLHLCGMDIVSYSVGLCLSIKQYLGMD